MTMEPAIFYADPSRITEAGVVLPKTEAHHAAKVLRLKKGDLVIVVDGLGNAHRGSISRLGRSGIVDVTFHSLTRNFGEPNAVLTLASGLSTGHKFDTIVEKGTELGVKRFVPVITEKSTVKIDDPRRARTKVSRYEKVALAAMKQCRRSYRPEIASPVSFKDYLNEIDSGSLNLIFHPAASATNLDDIAFEPGLKRVLIMVGPESGFSANEVALAIDLGVKPVNLGRRVLRTETAGPVACALIMNKLGELR